MSLPIWKDVMPSVLALLSDKTPVEGGGWTTSEYEEDDVRAWWNNAQMRLAVAKPQSRHQIYKESDGKTVVTPDYHYKARSMYVPGKPDPIPRLSMGEVLTNTVGYLLYEDTITLYGFQTLPAQWVYIYHAYYPKIVDEKSKVHVPEWAYEALSYYVGMQAMALEAIEDARYRKFTSPVDATGNPTHNPFLKVAEFYRERYFDIINAHADDEAEFR